MSGGKEEVMQDFMLKRAMSKAIWGAENYKDRWLVLSKDTLCYYTGTLAVSKTQFNQYSLLS